MSPVGPHPQVGDTVTVTRRITHAMLLQSTPDRVLIDHDANCTEWLEMDGTYTITRSEDSPDGDDTDTGRKAAIAWKVSPHSNYIVDQDGQHIAACGNEREAHRIVNEIDRLRSEADHWERFAKDNGGNLARRLAKAHAERDEAQAEVQRLTDALAAARRCCDTHGANCGTLAGRCCWNCHETHHPLHPPGIPCVLTDATGGAA